MATTTRQWVHIAILALLGSTLAMAHMVKPPKADLDHEVKPPKLADLDYVVKPSKLADLDHEVKPPKLADLDHKVKPPKRADLDHEVQPPKTFKLRKLQMEDSGEDQSSQTDGTDAPASGCGRGQAQETDPGWEEGVGEGEGIYGGGHGSGGATFGFHKINPFPAFPFGAFVPEVSTWGGGGGYGGSNAKPGKNTGVQCHCSNGIVMHMSPISFRPMDTMKRAGPDDMAPSSSP